VLEEGIAEDLVDALPIARDEALLVEVDEVALDLLAGIGLSCVGDTVHQVVADLIALHLLQGIAKGLEFLELTLSEQLFDDF